jgi:hypothetical protein
MTWRRLALIIFQGNNLKRVVAYATIALDV